MRKVNIYKYKNERFRRITAYICGGQNNIIYYNITPNDEMRIKP